MGDIIQFPDVGNVKRTSIQVSFYAQDDGSCLFCVEMLLPDGTWDRMGYYRDLGEAWKLAGKLSSDNGWDFLPESRWPGHSHLLAVGGA